MFRRAIHVLFECHRRVVQNCSRVVDDHVLFTAKMTQFPAWAPFLEEIGRNKRRKAAKDVWTSMAQAEMGRPEAVTPSDTLRDPCRDNWSAMDSANRMDRMDRMDASMFDEQEREEYDRMCREIDAMNAKAREDAETDMWKQAPIYDSDADAGQAWPPPKDISYLHDLGLVDLFCSDDDEDDDAILMDV